MTADEPIPDIAAGDVAAAAMAPDGKTAAGSTATRGGWRWFAVALVILWALAVGRTYLGLTIVPDDGTTATITGFDENCYYAYARSLLFDGDWNFANDYSFIVRHQHPDYSQPFTELLAGHPDRPRNHFNPGTGLAAVPLMELVCGVDHVVARVTGRDPAGEFSALPVFAYYVANITFGVLAVLLSALLAARVAGRSNGQLGAWAAVLTGPPVFYLFFGNGMSHLTSAFFVAAAVVSWAKWRDADAPARYWWAALTGLLVGFALTVRSTNLPLGLLLVEPLLVSVRRGNRRAQARDAACVLMAGASALAGLLPQLVAWQYLYGGWVVNTQGYRMAILPPHALQVLLSPRHGLLFWAPAYAFAVAGLAWACWQRQPRAAMLVLVLTGVVWIYGNWHTWWLGVSFGKRGFVDLLCVFAFGFAAAACWLERRFGAQSRRWAWEAVILFTILNLHLAHAFRSGATYVDGPLNWLDTVSHGRRYKEQLKREWEIVTAPAGRRQSLSADPVGYLDINQNGRE